MSTNTLKRVVHVLQTKSLIMHVNIKQCLVSFKNLRKHIFISEIKLTKKKTKYCAILRFKVHLY